MLVGASAYQCNPWSWCDGIHPGISSECILAGIDVSDDSPTPKAKLYLLFFFRFEGSIFFVYDRHFLQKEADLLEDAIIYFYPHSVCYIVQY